MHRRKNIGIIKYGGRQTHKTFLNKKLQSGGVVSVSKGYDWRDDPYELMLMRQKEAELNAKASKKGSSSRRSGSTSSDNASGMKGFDVLKGGLQGTRKKLNDDYKQLQQSYYNKVLNNPTEWITSKEGKYTYQQIVTYGKEAQELLSAEEQQFNTAVENLNDKDTEALAISENGFMMVYDSADKDYNFVHKKKYLEDMDRYEPQNIKEFIHWKQNTDISGASGDTRLINEFLVNNAMSPEAVISNYVTPNARALSYISENGMISPANDNKDVLKPDSPIADTEQWRKTLNAALTDTTAQGVTANTRDSILKAAGIVYSEILQSSGNENRLKASLYSEVLNDGAHKEKMKNLKTVEEREQYLELHAKYALVSKLYGGKSTSDSPSDSSSGSNKYPSDIIVGAYSELLEGDKLTTYEVHSDFTPEGQKGSQEVVAGIKVPKSESVVSSGGLNTVKDVDMAKKNGTSQNTITGNDLLREKADTGNVYLKNGMSINSKYGDSKGRSFVESSMRIVPETDVDIVYMPMDGKGTITAYDTAKVAQRKVDNRKLFLKFYKEQVRVFPDMKPIKLAPENIVEGSTKENVQFAYNMYKKWADSSTEVEERKKIMNSDKTNKEKVRRYEEARTAREMRQLNETFLTKLDTKLFGKMLKFDVVFDNDSVDLVDDAREYSKSVGYSPDVIKQAEANDNNYMETVNKVDASNLWLDWGKEGVWPVGDNYYRTTVLIPVNSLTKIFTASGENLESLPMYKKIEHEVNMLLNHNNPYSNPGNEEALSQFIRE